jgi:hypothetical protein
MQILSLIKNSPFPSHKEVIRDLAYSRRWSKQLKPLRIPSFLALSLVAAAVRNVLAVALSLKANGIVHFEFTSNEPSAELLQNASRLRDVCLDALSIKRTPGAWIEFRDKLIRCIMSWGLPKFHSRLNALNGLSKSDQDWRIEKAGRKISVERVRTLIKEVEPDNRWTVHHHILNRNRQYRDSRQDEQSKL